MRHHARSGGCTFSCADCAARNPGLRCLRQCLQTGRPLLSEVRYRFQRRCQHIASHAFAGNRGARSWTGTSTGASADTSTGISTGTDTGASTDCASAGAGTGAGSDAFKRRLHVADPRGGRSPAAAGGHDRRRGGAGGRDCGWRVLHAAACTEGNIASRRNRHRRADAACRHASTYACTRDHGVCTAGTCARGACIGTTAARTDCRGAGASADSRSGATVRTEGIASTGRQAANGTRAACTEAGCSSGRSTAT